MGDNAVRKILFVESKDIERNRPLRDAKTLIGTRKVHSGKDSSSRGKLLTRRLSCFCHECIHGHFEECNNTEYIDEWKTVTLKPLIPKYPPVNDINGHGQTREKGGMGVQTRGGRRSRGARTRGGQERRGGDEDRRGGDEVRGGRGQCRRGIENGHSSEDSSDDEISKDSSDDEISKDSSDDPRGEEWAYNSGVEEGADGIGALKKA
ncbi:uncharacterized protein LOC117336368 isoform X2 [Pecten maximus]|uniref:uncharacterized protein LOC117336368 isoform X2 n=1 Tax=Pecten maximus TaxID=6579 RepID=UPI00145890A8|nr:uncharacterized protein LOC117336368 isoform X2 [Pecten maximus]